MKHQIGGLGDRVVIIINVIINGCNILLCKQTVWTSQWHGRRFARIWQRFLASPSFPSLFLPLEVGHLIADRESGGAF